MIKKAVIKKDGYIESICYLTIIFIMFSTYSCQIDNSYDSGAKNTKLDTTKNTQAILLTQSFDFDVTNKDKIVGEYISREKITVPQNLSTQSKWIMFEGPVLENDLVAYRYYADSRHRFDIYGKSVSDLVMDTVSWKYHDIMNWGSDILKVGNSLGLGSPAIYSKDSLYYLTKCEEKVIEVVENSTNFSMIRTTFSGLKVAGQTFDLVQDWSLKAGEAWSEIQLKIVGGDLPVGMKFATGFVKHLPEVIQGVNNEVFYAMNWGKQSFHKEGLGMAILANQKYGPKHIMDDESHLYLFNNAKNEVTYRFLSAWEKDMNRVKNVLGLKLLVEKAGKGL